MTALWIVLGIAGIFALQEWESRRDKRDFKILIDRFEQLATRKIRTQIADEIRDYAAKNVQVSMKDVMRIVEGA